MENQKNMWENGYIPFTNWPNRKIKMLPPNVKEKQVNINCILLTDSLPLFSRAIIRKIFKSIKLLNKHPNDNFQMYR